MKQTENPVLAEGTVIIKNAVKGERNFEHFGIHPVTASIYGHSISEIVEVKLAIAKDQTRPAPHAGDMTVDYWGWFDFEEQEITLVWPKRFLLDMCFPAGIDATEKANQGKAYRLEIVEQ